MEIRDCLCENIKPGQKYAVLGIGSVLRSDDAAGMYFIEFLSNMLKRDDVLLIAGSTAPENFTGVIKDFAPDKLFIIDAAFMGLSPGEAKNVPARDIGGVSFSTHMLPLPVMLEYLKSEAHCTVIFFGIQPESTGQELFMCDEVKRGTERLAQAFYDAFSDVVTAGS
jgi:hydrogenase 3 maturation protease